MLRLLTNFAAAGAVLPAAEAILVAPNSPCSTNCGNVLDSTSTGDIVCAPGQYAGGYGNGAGAVFKGCIECELGSGYTTKDNHTDNMAALYNLRYAVSYCVFNEPPHHDFVDSPCVTSKACGAFTEAIAYHNLSVDYDDYGYCAAWPIGDTVDYHGCIECLQVTNRYLANFITVLEAGCEQRPIPGANLGLQGNIFSSDIVNITDPTPTAEADPAWIDHGPLTLGGKVGIAAGGFILLLILAGAAVICKGRRRRRAFLRNLQANMPQMKSNPGGWPSMPAQHDANETPLSQRPLRSWDDSPMTISTEKTFPRYFSPYSSQFNSPISATDANHMPWPEPALASPHSPREIGLALGSAVDTDNNGSNERWPLSPGDKGKMKDESYEMQHVDSAGSAIVPNKQPIHVEAPILGHPGYGRNSDSPPRQYDVNGNVV
ncbi:centromere microtubule binding cbf5 [Trichoderma cornu-damae]|uniref:Centromere microtubule binding cbf5 n=1 Tax=Trichoderma cornu-damae TaxID=654480 RepID=A0A9P8QTH0_9HYPO|nr:centromere microtubule binding cbf5 [Trichoderma cornu-damae]